MFKTVQTITTFRNRLADPVGTRRGPPLVRGPQFENRCFNVRSKADISQLNLPHRDSVNYVQVKYYVSSFPMHCNRSP